MIPRRLQARTSSRAGVGQAGASVGAMREGEWHAGGEGVGTAPDEAERAQPRRVEDVQRIQPWINRLGALEVQDRGEYTIAQAGVHLIGRAHDLDLTLRLRFELEQSRDESASPRVAHSRGRAAAAVRASSRGPVRVGASSGFSAGGGGMKTAKKPPAKPPSRARGRSRWPSSLRVKNERSLPSSALYTLSSTSLCPSITGMGLSAISISSLFKGFRCRSSCSLAVLCTQPASRSVHDLTNRRAQWLSLARGCTDRRDPPRGSC